MTDVADVTPDGGEDLLEQGGWLLDVREGEEWRAGHAPEAVWIPLGEVGARADEIPRDRTVVAICRSGARSRAVAEALARAGYDVVNVAGGMRAWAATGRAVVADGGAPGTVI